jgi:hypothetical protein
MSQVAASRRMGRCGCRKSTGMPVQPKFPGLNSFPSIHRRKYQQKPPLLRKEAVFIEFLKLEFTKINFPIDNPKTML